MKEILKDTYLLPECRVMEVKLQGMIALSGNDNEGFVNEPGSWS
jgi:hypothetical protein